MSIFARLVSLAITACLITGSIAGPAMARLAPGSIGNGGRLSETMSPGALPPPQTSIPSAHESTPLTSYGARYPDTGSYSGSGYQFGGGLSGRMQGWPTSRLLAGHT